MKEARNFPFPGLLFFSIATLHLFMHHLNTLLLTEAGIVGMNYGMVAENLPPPDDVVSLLKSKNITRVRLFNPTQEALQALHNTGIQLTLGTLNQDLQPLATDPAFATEWVRNNVIPHAETVCFRAISVGDEVIPGDLQNFVFPAMQNLKTALEATGLAGGDRRIPVTTAVAATVLGTSYPPSGGEFSEAAAPSMSLIAGFLAENRSPLLVNVYPYFAYVNDQKDIPLAYALFNSSQVVVRDGALDYFNLFDAMIDAFHSALERVGGGSAVEVVVSESGWPSGGDSGGATATVENAEMYNSNLIRHVSGDSGTPKRPGKSVETYVFALFNEDLKPGAGTERNFGLFYPNMTEVYHVDFA